MEFLRQNTATTIVIALVDYADGKTMPPEITLTDLKCTIYKNGVGAELTLSSGGDNAFNLSNLEDGMATLTLTVSNTDTVGRLKVIISNELTNGEESAAILRSIADFEILHADAYDALVLGDLAEPDGVAASLWQKINQTWRRFFKKATCSDTELKTFKDNGTTVNTTQAVSDSGTIETVGDAE